MTQEEQDRLKAEFEAKFRQEQIDLRFEVMRAQQRHAIAQAEINQRPTRMYSLIVAADLRGAFSKGGEIPWNYKEDFGWFQRRTKGHICVMGRTTYEDINKRLGNKAEKSVLPDRQCFVVTSSPLPRANATAIARLGDLDKHLYDVDIEKTVFFCGGEGIYREGIAYCDQLLITVVNKDVEGDRFIPKKSILRDFEVHQIFKAQDTPEIRFVVYRRKRG